MDASYSGFQGPLILFVVEVGTRYRPSTVAKKRFLDETSLITHRRSRNINCSSIIIIYQQGKKEIDKKNHITSPKTLATDSLFIIISNIRLPSSSSYSSSYSGTETL